MLKYCEMDKELQDAVVFGFCRRMGCTESSARRYLDKHPEFHVNTLREMEVGSEEWNEMLKDIIWEGKGDEEIVALCS
ncbi:MAG: hypothetical protein ACW99G_01790 [Candidatus Thorarchaeota archaeon]|jgi:hypothetical protein